MRIDWIQPVVATASCWRERSSSSNTSAGVFHLSHLRSLLLSASVTASRSSADKRDRSVPFGMYLVQQPVSVHIRGPLPRRGRVGEANLHVDLERELGMRGEFLAAVQSERPAQVLRKGRH